MDAENDAITRSVFWFALLVGLWLIFNLVAMPLAWGGVDAEGGVLGAIQLAMLLGFVLVILFDLASIGWVALNGRIRIRAGEVAGLLFLGGLALVGMMGAKVMVDEIARETPLGGAGGEWGVLYACLVLQLSYILTVMFRTKPKGSER